MSEIAGTLRSLQDSYRMSPATFLPELPTCGVSLSRWRRDETTPSHLIEHRLATYTLSLILRPMAGRAWLGKTTVWSGPIQADTSRLTPPGVEPCWQSDGAFDFLLFTIPASVIETIAGTRADPIHTRLRAAGPLYVRDPTVLQIGRQMLLASESSAPYARQFADGLGFALVAHLLNHFATDRANTQQTTLSPFICRRLACYALERLDQPLTSAALAQVAGLSTAHFARAFHASFGVTPHQYVTDLRLQRARELLLQPGKSIGCIAQACGFQDASHFTRVFRKHLGLTPRDYRRSSS